MNTRNLELTSILDFLWGKKCIYFNDFFFEDF